MHLKKLIIVILLAVSHHAFGMIKHEPEPKKIFSKTFQTALQIQAFGHPAENDLVKTVIVMTPARMSPGKAETYFNKNRTKLEDEVQQLLRLCVTLVYVTEAGNGDGQEPMRICYPDLYKMVHNPASRFCYKPGWGNIFIERPLGGDSSNWHFTELLEITANEQLIHKGVCGPLKVQCHNDTIDIHDKILASVLSQLYNNTFQLPVIIKDVNYANQQAEHERQGHIVLVDNTDQRLCIMATYYVNSCEKYKQLFGMK